MMLRWLSFLPGEASATRAAVAQAAQMSNTRNESRRKGDDIARPHLAPAAGRGKTVILQR